jgi:ribosomal protein S18 acetylase RimI-like enzyme
VGGQVAGFVSNSVNSREARIPLIATNAEFRRTGIGRALVARAVSWSAEQGVPVAHVKTQAHNYPALALYHRAGYVVSKTELTFSVTLAQH